MRYVNARALGHRLEWNAIQTLIDIPSVGTRGLEDGVADPKFEQFRGEKYISLQTFKKNGQGVKTPVWFVLHTDGLYGPEPLTLRIISSARRRR